MSQTSDPVMFQVRESRRGKQIGHVRLNAPEQLNALNLTMIQMLLEQLQMWEQDDNIACVVLDSTSDKALCAGGDIRALYHASTKSMKQGIEQATTFFSKEYELDYFIHQMKTPMIVWGHGIVMGGGIGLMAGAHHRVATETSMLAMPEVTIGLYPDVGGTYFLNRMPDGMGMFLGLTGYRMSGADAKYVKLADVLIDSAKKDTMLEALDNMLWEKEHEKNQELIAYALTKLSEESELIHEPSTLFEYQKDISDWMEGDLLDIQQKIMALSPQHPWLEKAQKTMVQGSALSKYLIWNQLNQTHHLSLADVFRQELAMSLHCIEQGDFLEGVRALLIDKDGSPQWKYSDVSAIKKSLITDFIDRSWSQGHPLKHL